MAFYSNSKFLVWKYKRKIGVNSKTRAMASHFTNSLLTADKLKESRYNIHMSVLACHLNNVFNIISLIDYYFINYINKLHL